MSDGDLSHIKKGNNFRPDSTESNKEHGQGLGGSSLVRSTMICFYHQVISFIRLLRVMRVANGLERTMRLCVGLTGTVCLDLQP